MTTRTESTSVSSQSLLKKYDLLNQYYTNNYTNFSEKISLAETLKKKVMLWSHRYDSGNFSTEQLLQDKTNLCRELLPSSEAARKVSETALRVLFCIQDMKHTGFAKKEETQEKLQTLEQQYHEWKLLQEHGSNALKEVEEAVDKMCEKAYRLESSNNS